MSEIRELLVIERVRRLTPGQELAGLDASIEYLRGHLEWLHEGFAAIAEARKAGVLREPSRA